VGLVPQVTEGSPPQPDLRLRLQRGESVRALFVGTSDATLCELAALLGWDMLIVDAEHGAVIPRDMENIARACERRGATAAARVPLGAPAEVGRYLDAGALAVMIPMVESAQQAERAVELVKYPPRGRRGVAAPRCADFGLLSEASEEFARANRDTVVIVQIESIRGLEQAEAIAAVDGIDVVFAGPADLSLALGVPLRWESPAFVSAIERVAAAARSACKVFGAYAGDRERMSWYEMKGARLIAAALEDLIVLGSQRLRE